MIEVFMLMVFGIAVEWAWNRPSSLRDCLAGFLFYFGAELVGAICVLTWWYTTGIPEGAWPRSLFLVECLSLLVLSEVSWYWLHRWGHTRQGWPWHRWHHVPDRYGVWLTPIGHPVFVVMAVVSRVIPGLALGASPEAYAVVGIFQMGISTVGHYNVDAGRWLSRIVVTPALHRWHHAPGARVNYGLSLTLWDQVFRTYYLPRREAARLGVKDQGPGEYEISDQLLDPFRRGVG
ncbi:sterol desaturase family protein [Ectothiorhodospiraceae bacterium WFHF3C12]|nr:sterol desaturase family protein [Ectothiorhodospiraceae bacterium WFHF3C12]